MAKQFILRLFLDLLLPPGIRSITGTKIMSVCALKLPPPPLVILLFLEINFIQCLIMVVDLLQSGGGVLKAPIVNDTVIMVAAPVGDTFGCDPITTNMAHKIALIWRGPAGPDACDFSQKVAYAQAQGAVAVVLINEYAGQGPVDMGAGSAAAGDTIPVYMIGNADGVAIAGAYDAGGLGSVKMTITPWGLLKPNDLGFVPGGYGIWHDYAIPYYEVQRADAPPIAYWSSNGAFIANYGTNNAYGVHLKSYLSFTPNGGSAVYVDSESETLADTFKVVDPTHTKDSIWAFYSPRYNLNNANVAAPGVFNLTYTISSDSVDDYPADNSLTYSFYATDSIYSKGQYNFTTNQPMVTQWFEPDATNYLWGVPYFVSQGGPAIKSVQVSPAAGVGLLPDGGAVEILVFKWNINPAAVPNIDTIVTGQLSLVGAGSYAFNGTSDSSFNIFNVSIDSVNAAADTTYNVHPMLDSNSWYFVVADMENAFNSQALALGCDGILDAYPRSYFRYHAEGYREFYNPMADSDFADLTINLPNDRWATYAFPGESAADNAAGISFF